MLYNFDWDPAKEGANIHKHRLNFRLAATIFYDPNQVSIFDEAHNTEEDR